jgi:hypothetical protein
MPPKTGTSPFIPLIGMRRGKKPSWLMRKPAYSRKTAATGITSSGIMRHRRQGWYRPGDREPVQGTV